VDDYRLTVGIYLKPWRRRLSRPQTPRETHARTTREGAQRQARAGGRPAVHRARLRRGRHEDILRRGRRQPRALYNHFPGKLDLFESGSTTRRSELVADSRADGQVPAPTRLAARHSRLPRAVPDVAVPPPHRTSARLRTSSVGSAGAAPQCSTARTRHLAIVRAAIDAVVVTPRDPEPDRPAPPRRPDRRRAAVIAADDQGARRPKSIVIGSSSMARPTE